MPQFSYLVIYYNLILLLCSLGDQNLNLLALDYPATQGVKEEWDSLVSQV